MSAAALALGAMTWFAPDASTQAGLSAGGGPGLVLRGEAALPALRVEGRWADPDGGLGLNATVTGLASATPDGFATLGARWLVVDRPRLRLAPMVGTAGHVGVNPLDTRLTARIGLALEGGGERLGWDASIYLGGAQLFPAPTVETRLSLLSPLEGALPLEAGLRWSWAESHALRLGLVSIFPTLSYRYERQRLYAELAAGTMGSNSLLLSRVGWRWP